MDDCAFNEDCWCSVLKHKKCSGCTFYKTKKQLENEQYCSEIRLKVLGKWDYYKEKYKLVERGRFRW